MAFWKNSIDVSLQDQASDIIELALFRSLGTVTLASPITEGQYQFTLVAGHGVVVGNMISIVYAGKWYQCVVTNVATNVITVGSPLDFDVPVVGSILRRGTDNMASASASQASPLIYSVAPPAGVKWHLTRFSLHIMDGTAMDDATFGGIAALTNGCVLRIIDGYTKNILTLRTNHDIFLHGDETSYSAKAPSGKYGLFSIKRLGGQENTGVVALLDGTAGDRIEFLIQDDLTNLDEMHVIAMGHKVID